MLLLLELSISCGSIFDVIVFVSDEINSYVDFSVCFPINPSLMLLEVDLNISVTAIALKEQTAGAKTIYNLFITHEKYTIKTPYMPKNNFPRVIL